MGGGGGGGGLSVDASTTTHIFPRIFFVVEILSRHDFIVVDVVDVCVEFVLFKL